MLWAGRAEAITMPEAEEMVDAQLDLPLFDSTFDADATVRANL